MDLQTGVITICGSSDETTVCVKIEEQSTGKVKRHCSSHADRTVASMGPDMCRTVEIPFHSYTEDGPGPMRKSWVNFCTCNKDYCNSSERMALKTLLFALTLLFHLFR